MARSRSFLARWGRWLRWGFRLLLVALIVDLVYIAVIWPDWTRLRRGAVPKSNFIVSYEEQRAEKHWPALQWQPVSIAEIPRHLERAVLLSEDVRFYTHSGFDFAAIREAIDLNLEKKQLAIGASTVSQQTAKNLFLSPSRNPLRKWHEMFLTVGLEHHLSKTRILEVYLNTAEFGRGIYGVQAAALAYWGIPASQLSVTQAAELAVSLPSPTKHNPLTRTEQFMKRRQRLLTLLAREYDLHSGNGAPALLN
jgi:monofunctional biosynthetic peptidoglycan transglycosylase